MTRQLFILTGASRGLGAAMATQLLSPANRLLCLSRHTSQTLADKAAERSAACEQWPVDLARTTEAATRLQQWLQQFDTSEFERATLINNAAALADIGPLGDCDIAVLSASLRVSLEAPVLLTAAFLHATGSWSATRRVLNISSGLGRRAMAAQSPYCAVKAGLDHFSRALALEEAGRDNGARIVSLAPGVIDTDMQVQLRAAGAAGFPDLDRFVGLKADGRLASSDVAATSVLAYLDRPDFGSNPVADVRDQ